MSHSPDQETSRFGSCTASEGRLLSSKQCYKSLKTNDLRRLKDRTYSPRSLKKPEEPSLLGPSARLLEERLLRLRIPMYLDEQTVPQARCAHSTARDPKTVFRASEGRSEAHASRANSAKQCNPEPSATSGS